MKFEYTAHIEDRIKERGTNKPEVETTMKNGKRLPDQLGRIKFVCNFNCHVTRSGVDYNQKRVEVSAVCTDIRSNSWKLITVIVKYFNI